MIVVNGISVEAVVWTLMALVGMWYAFHGWMQARRDHEAEAQRGALASPARLLLSQMYKTATGTRLTALLAFLVIGVASLVHGTEDASEPQSIPFTILFEALMFTALGAMTRASFLEIRRNERLYAMYDEDGR